MSHAFRPLSRFLLSALLPVFLFATYAATRISAATPAPQRPNIVFILADDLALGDLGCYGQKIIRTPNIDRMAAEGTRFTQAYSGTSVCAPSRTSLMIGKHIGHSPVRGNRRIAEEGQLPLPAGTVTVASILKGAGYATACAGKWGMGFFDTSGSPLKVGFDHFFGYNCQTHAHSYYPTHLYRDDRRFALDGKTYAQNLIQSDVESWIRSHARQPFFVFYAVTLPHAKLEIDDLGAYASLDATPQARTYAAMVSRLDRDVGRLLDLLRELGIDRNTLVLFAGDNGSSHAPDSALGQYFAQAQGMRGFKRTMYEGGLKQGALAWWPGRVPAGRVSDGLWAFWDFMPTAAELAGTKVPSSWATDGKSIVPLLLGGKAPKRDYLYWELHEPRFQQAVRFDNWKAVRATLRAPVELYDLAADPSESNNLAGSRLDLVARAEAYLKAARVDDPEWPIDSTAKKKKKG